ncbi:MAG: hypothetical protein QW478_04155 [Candidatus Micrarchaeaceae archaeon]
MIGINVTGRPHIYPGGTGSLHNSNYVSISGKIYHNGQLISPPAKTTTAVQKGTTVQTIDNISIVKTSTSTTYNTDYNQKYITVNENNAHTTEETINETASQSTFSLYMMIGLIAVVAVMGIAIVLKK